MKIFLPKTVPMMAGPMRLIKRCLALTLFVTMTAACATPYVGPAPNFSAKGKDAELEVDRFSMAESFWVQSADGIHMGPKGELYTNSSLRPLMSQVSPNAVATLDRADNLYIWSLVTLGVALGSIVAASSTSNIGTQQGWALLGIGTALSSIGLSIGAIAERTDAIKRYNQDLKQHFGIPTVTWNYSFE